MNAISLPSRLKPPTYYGIVIDTGRNGFDPAKGIVATMRFDDWNNRYEMKEGLDGDNERRIRDDCGPSASSEVPFWTSFCHRPMFQIPTNYWSDHGGAVERRTDELVAWLIGELGGEGLAELPLSVVHALIPKGSPGKDYFQPLESHGQANIFFFRDSTGALKPHDVHWDNSGWHIWPIRLPFSSEWSRDGLDSYDFYSRSRIFSRPRSLLCAESAKPVWV